MSKKILILFLALIILLMGCNKPPTYEHSEEIMGAVKETDTQDESVRIAETDIADSNTQGSTIKSVDIMFPENWMRGKQNSQYRINQMRKVLNEVLLQDLNIEVSFEWIESSVYADQVHARLASDTCPDLVEINERYKMDVAQWAQMGLIADIGDQIGQYMPKTMSNMGIIPGFYNTEENINGMYILPAIDYNPIRYIVCVPQSLQDLYGNQIQTLEEYGDYMEWVKQTQPDMIPGYVKSQVFFDSYIRGAGYSPGLLETSYTYIQDGRIRSQSIENIPEFSQAYTLLHSWIAQRIFCYSRRMCVVLSCFI